MRSKIYILPPALMALPGLSHAGVFPAGKKFEFIAIASFIILSLGSIFIYYLVWKSKQIKEKTGKKRYVIRSVQVTSNGRTYVKSKRIRLMEEPKRMPRRIRG